MAWGEKHKPSRGTSRDDIERFPQDAAHEVLRYTNIKGMDTEPLQKALEAYAATKLEEFLEFDQKGKALAASIGYPLSDMRDFEAAEILRAKFSMYKSSMRGVFERESLEQNINRIDQMIERKLSLLAFGVHPSTSNSAER